MKQTSRADRVSPILQHILDASVVLIILLVGWVYTHGIEQVLDIGLYDESDYLHRGILIPSSGFPHAQSAPLYSLWYYTLSFAQPDTIQLYFLNYKLMTVLPPLVLFIVLRAYSVSRIVSFVLSLGFLFSSANFPTWPKVSHFAVVVLLCGFFLFSFFRDQRLQTCALVTAALLASYIRPECFLTFICLSVVLVVVTFVRLRLTRSLRSTIPLLVTLIPLLILVFWLGPPMGSGNRSMAAFSQHYARNWTSWHNDERNPWTNWDTIVANDFGDAESPREALLTNPLAVTRHIAHNVRTLPSELERMFGSTYPHNWNANVALKLGILMILAAGVPYLRKDVIRTAVGRLVVNCKHAWFPALCLLVVLLPVAVSILLIAPRRHYLYIFGVMLVFGLATLFFRNTHQNAEHSSYSIFALLCIAMLLTTRPLSNSIKVTAQPNLSTIRFLRSLDITVPIKVLEAEGGYGIYVGRNYTRVAEYNKRVPFEDFLAERSIDMVIESDRLSQDVRFSEDPEWHSFTNAPSRFGFTQVAMPAVEGRRLFIRKEIVQTPRSTE